MCHVDDNTIELHVVGRLTDSTASDHIRVCDRCTQRAVEQANFIELLKRGLRDFDEG